MNGELHSLVLSLLAGLQTVFSPCLFPVLPAYLIFLARQVGNSLKVTLAFVAALSTSLLVYAIVVASIGQALLIALSLTPDTISFVLATVFACLAVIELSPAKHIFSLFTYQRLEVKRASVASSAMLGALFALAAAPCASAPLLAWTAILLLHPGSILPSLAAFLVGVAAPFTLVGVLAQSVGLRLHKALIRSFLVKHSYEFSATLFAIFAFIVLSSISNPLSLIEKHGFWLNEFAKILLSLALLYAGVNLLLTVPRANHVALLLLATLPAITGVTGVIAFSYHVLTLQESFITPLSNQFSVIPSAVTAASWITATIKGGGRVSRWIALSALAQTFCTLFTLLPFPTLLHSEVAISGYILCAVSVGIALSLLAALAQAKRL